MKRKMFALLIVSVLTLLIGACGDTAETESLTEAVETVAEMETPAQTVETVAEMETPTGGVEVAAQAETKIETESESIIQTENAVSETELSTVAESETQITEAQTEYVQMVWIPSTGSKYHRNSSCSNMNSPRQVSITEAEQLGYTPCKKCY